MKRFISISLALLLGFASAQELFTPNQPVFLADGTTPTGDGTTPPPENKSSIKDKLAEASDKLSRLSCYLYDDLTIFDLRSLESDAGYSVQGNTKVNDQLTTYNFNFCRTFKITNAEKKEKKTFIYKTTTEGDVPLTDDDKPHYTETVLTNSDNENDARGHIKFVQNDGADCSKDKDGKEIEYEVEYEVFCDPAITDNTKIAFNIDDSNQCRPKISFSHKTGCPVFRATSVVRWFANHPEVLGVLLIIFGAVVTFYGGKFFPYVLAIISGSLTFLIVLLLASVIGALKALDKNRDPTGGQIAAAFFSFLVAILAGLFVGWFLKKMRRIGICILGAAAGFFGGFLLYTFVFAQWADHVAVLAVTSGILCILGGFIAWKFDRHLIVYLTAFFGAYALIRGISVFAGHFPNEMVVYGELEAGTFDGLTWEFYAYFFSIIITAVLGVLYQFKKGFQLHHQNDEDYQKF